MTVKLKNKLEIGWVKHVDFTVDNWKSIEQIINCKISSDKRQQINDDISSIAQMRLLDTPHISAQDTKNDLKLIAKSNTKKMSDALDKINKNAHIEINSSLFSMQPDSRKMKFNFNEYPPNAYRAAALLALNDMPDGVKSTNIYRSKLAEYIISLWNKLGKTDGKAWARDDDASPLVKFASILICVIEKENAPSYSVVAKLLNKYKVIA